MGRGAVLRDDSVVLPFGRCAVVRDEGVMMGRGTVAGM